MMMGIGIRIVLAVFGLAAAEQTGSVTSRNAATQRALDARVVFFVDRFGDIWQSGRQVTIETIKKSANGSGKKLIEIVYEPMSPESDVRDLEESVKRSSRQSRVSIRKVESNDGYAGAEFPAHEPEVQYEALRQSDGHWDKLLSRHYGLAEQIQNYIKNLSRQVAAVTADVETLRNLRTATQPGGDNVTR